MSQSKRLNIGIISRMLIASLLFILPTMAQTFTNASSMLNPSANGFEWGASAADFNNDGWVDIYERDKLYLNDRGNGFRDIFAETGLNEGSGTFGAVFGDYNDDGYLDIFFENFGSPSFLFRNLGNRFFTNANSDANINVSVLVQTCGWADFNRDGTLDFFIDEDRGNNIMLKNIDSQRFENISASAGAPTNGNSYGMSWGDYNNDGFPDVFIATCPGGFENHLLHNNGDETFTNVGQAAGVNDRSSSWGNVWLDYNNDGFLDVYIANTSSDPNILYRNNGDGTFTDVSNTAGVTNNGGFGCAIADFDNDGWVDIYAATSSPQHSLYRNNGDGTFTDIAVTAGVFEGSHDAVALADYNNDGWMDVFTAGSPNNILLLNDGGTNHWLGIRTRGVSSNYFGVSARVEVYGNNLRQIRDITAGSSFCSQSDQLRPIFGLGSSNMVDSVIVRWSSGIVDIIRDIPTDQYITVVEGVGLNYSPELSNIVTPAEGDSLEGASLEFSWEAAANPENEDLTYRLRIWGALSDTLINVVNDTVYYLPGNALPGPGNYAWQIEVSDGYSLVSGSEITSFYANPTMELFTPVMTNLISADGSYSEGIIWTDFNLDGFDDIFVANISTQTNLLYYSDGGGDFTLNDSSEVTASAGDSYGGSSGDFNNDGFPDLFVARGRFNNSQLNNLFMNDGQGNLTEVQTGAIVTDPSRSWSTSVVDYDRDGFLDVFVANYNQENFLYQNDGQGGFTKVTEGAIVNEISFSLGNAWADIDLDGDPDLFVANADIVSGNGAPNFLYINNGDGTFSAAPEGRIVTDTDLSVGGSFGDYDGDGDPDLFVTNYGGQDNALYRNDGGGLFTREILSRIGSDGGSSVGSAWGDFDNDGDLDLYVANDLNENNFFYENIGGTFRSLRSSVLSSTGGRSNGTAWSDYDRDGDIDLFITNGQASPVQDNILFQNNNFFAGNNWIGIDLEGTRSNKSAIGARVDILTTISGVPTWQTRELTGQSGYNSQPSPTLHFGLGEATSIDSIRIKWPSGALERLGSYDANQFISLTEDPNLVGIGDPVLAASDFILDQNYPNPFNPSTRIVFHMGEAGQAELTIFNILGQKVRNLLNDQAASGRNEIVWDGRDNLGARVVSGVYVYQLRVGDKVQSRKMLMIK